MVGVMSGDVVLHITEQHAAVCVFVSVRVSSDPVTVFAQYCVDQFNCLAVAVLLTGGPLIPSCQPTAQLDSLCGC